MQYFLCLVLLWLAGCAPGTAVPVIGAAVDAQAVGPDTALVDGAGATTPVDAGAEVADAIVVADMTDAAPGCPAPCVGLTSPCTATADCSAGKVCDKASHACVACVAAVDCGPGALCLDHACVASKACKSDGECKVSNQVCAKADGACADCNVDADCAGGQTCQQYVCVASKPCKTSKECAVVCDTGKGVCAECVTSVDCPADRYCAAGKCAPDQCKASVCLGTTLFDCQADGAGYGPGKACDDGNVCTTDACSAGTCTYSAPKVCDDGNPCTDDACDKGVGCTAAVNTMSCNDGNACTQKDTCFGGTCTGNAQACDDDNPCTKDACQGGQCLGVALDGPCDDGDKCTDGEVCSNGKCAGGKAKVCDDGNACTTDGCDKTLGCVFTAAPNATCDDGDACTNGDSCATGQCKGAAKACDDGNLCTDDACVSGVCSHVNNGAACGAAGTCSQCKAGACVPGTGKAGAEWTFSGIQGVKLAGAVAVGGGEFVAAGTLFGGANNSLDGWLVRVGSDGGKVWEKAFGTAAPEQFHGVLASGAGWLAWGELGSQPWAVQTDAAGKQLWPALFSANGLVAHGAAVTAGGEYLAGDDESGPVKKSWLVRMDTGGTTLWQTSFPEAANLTAMAAFADGSLLLAGQNPSHGAVVLHVQATGAVLWAQTLPGPAQNTFAVTTAGTDAIIAVQLDMGGSPPADLTLLRLDATGKQVWQQGFTAPGKVQPIGVVTEADGTLALGAQVQLTGTGFDGWLLHTSATGKLVSTHIYGGPGTDALLGIAATQNGLVLAGWRDPMVIGGGDQMGWLLVTDGDGMLGCSCTQDADCADQKPCTQDTCSNGICKHPGVAVFTSCPGGVCDGGGGCKPTACGDGWCMPGETATSCSSDCAGQLAGCAATGTKTCSGCACEACVCLGTATQAADAYCCKNSWDATCAKECGQCAVGYCPK